MDVIYIKLSLWKELLNCKVYHTMCIRPHRPSGPIQWKFALSRSYKSANRKISMPLMRKGGGERGGARLDCLIYLWWGFWWRGWSTQFSQWWSSRSWTWGHMSVHSPWPCLPGIPGLLLLLLVLLGTHQPSLLLPLQGFTLLHLLHLIIYPVDSRSCSKFDLIYLIKFCVNQKTVKKNWWA